MAQFCSLCGTQLAQGAKFCTSCGAPVPQMRSHRPQEPVATPQARATTQTRATSRAQTYQCPNCGGVMSFDAAKGRLVCLHCGHEYEEGEQSGLLPVNAAPVERAAQAHAKTVEDFLERAPWQVVAEMGNSVSYTCPSCAAQIVADQSVVSTSCPYCGNNMLVSGIATAENIPQKIMPFSVTKQDAEELMRRHFEHKWYLSRAFNAQLEHMQGVYVPYHLYSMRVWGRARYLGYHEVSDDDGNSTRFYYAIRRAGHASFENIPVDGSSKMPDGHMDAIAPFDFGKLHDFSAGYVAGYLMEVADEDADACLPRAEGRARHSFEDDLQRDARREARIDGIEEVVASETNVSLEGVTSCVLPVWLMHCTWRDEQMLFAVNGDTGACVGDLPVDKKRRVTTVAVTAVTLVAIALVLFVTAVMGSDDDAEFLGGAVFVIILLTYLVDGHFMSQMRTAVEATGASMSYDSEGLVVTERWRSKHRSGRSRALRQLEE